MKPIDLSTINLNMTEDDKKRPLIFFEAHEYATVHLDEWRKIGISPVCFADKDETKHNTEFCGYKVYSVGEALALYPDALIVITNGNKFITNDVEYLREIVDANRIRHPMETYYGLGCPNLGTSCTIHGDNIICCIGKRFTVPGVTTFDSWDKIFTSYPNFSKSIIQKLASAETNACSGCKELYKGFWVTNPEINHLIFDSGFRDAKCHYKCPHCSHPFIKRVKDGRYDHLIPSEFLKYFWENHKKLGIKVNYANFNVSLPIGEPVLLPDLPKLLEFINSVKEINPFFLTTASIYSENWASILRKDEKARMIVDISAGTVETYEKCKGVTSLDKVVENMKKYVNIAINSDNITIKYIFFDGINDNLADVNGFLQIAKELRCKVEVSNDVYQELETTENIRELFLYMVGELKKNNINVALNATQAAAFYDIGEMK